MSDEYVDKLPPHNPEAEEAVLGSILIDPDSIGEIISFLKPQAFYRSQNRWIYECLVRLHERSRPIDYVTLLDELKRADHLEDVGGEPYLISLLSAVPTSLNVEYYGRLVDENAIRRGLLSAAGRIAKAAYDMESDVDEVIGESEKELFIVTAGMTADTVKTSAQVMSELFDLTEQRRDSGSKPVGFLSGLSDLDRLLGGLQEGKLITLAGRPGMGKTAMKLSMALGLAKNGASVMIFNLEMTSDEIARRLAAIESGISYTDILVGKLDDDEFARFGRAVGRLSELPLYIDASPGLTLNQMAARCRRQQAVRGLDVVFLDYVGLLGHERSFVNDTARMTDITRQLKTLALQLRVPIVMLAQLNRAVEARGDKRPILSDLRDSGSLEQDSDVVMFAYRDEYYNSDTTMFPNQAEINVAKHRNGPEGTVTFYFHKSTMSFRNLARQIDV